MRRRHTNITTAVFINRTIQTRTEILQSWPVLVPVLTPPSLQAGCFFRLLLPPTLKSCIQSSFRTHFAAPFWFVREFFCKPAPLLRSVVCRFHPHHTPAPARRNFRSEAPLARMSDHRPALSSTMKLQPLSQASTTTASPSSKQLQQNSLVGSINASLQRVQGIVASRKQDDFSERRVLEAYERYKAMFLKPAMRMALDENSEQQDNIIQKESRERQQQEEQHASIQRQLQLQQKQRLESLLPRSPEREQLPPRPSSSLTPDASSHNPCAAPLAAF
jgi:hypothetical protein